MGVRVRSSMEVREQADVAGLDRLGICGSHSSFDGQRHIIRNRDLSIEVLNQGIYVGKTDPVLIR